MRYQYSLTIPQGLEKVYEQAASYPRFVDFYRTGEILESTETHAKVRLSAVFFGKVFSWEGEGVKTRNQRISWVQTDGLLAGMTVDWDFKAVPTGTAVQLTSTLRTRNQLWNWFATQLFIKRTFKRLLPCLARACERTSHD